MDISVKLSFEGVIRVDGELLRYIYIFQCNPLLIYTYSISSVSPRRDSIMFSTSDPPAVQRIPWPSVDEVQDEESSNRTLLGHDTWIINDRELPWLINPNGMTSSFTESPVS